MFWFVFPTIKSLPNWYLTELLTPRYSLLCFAVNKLGKRNAYCFLLGTINSPTSFLLKHSVMKMYFPLTKVNFNNNFCHLFRFIFFPFIFLQEMLFRLLATGPSLTLSLLATRSNPIPWPLQMFPKQPWNPGRSLASSRPVQIYT